MISKDLIKKIKKIEIKSNKIANTLFSGEYHSYFKGNGMEFEDIREYYPGDDIRNIDWNVTARQGKAYVKQYKEERELNMFLLVDISRSNFFGNKKDIIAEIGATLSFSAMKNNDKIGSILFTDKIDKIIPSKKGKKHVLSIIENILDYKSENKKTDIQNALEYFNRIQKKRSIVFLISDFLDSGYEDQIKMISKKHDLVLIRIIDRMEEKLPKGAIFSFEDLETGEEITIENLKKDRTLNINKNIPSKNLITIYTDEDYIKPLKLFFEKRI
ncbi:MAG: DUF58 domain-containing protein [Fusobacteriota bacterium]